MKKFMMICAAAVSMFLVACGGGDKTSASMNEQISVYEAATKKLENAKASDVDAIQKEVTEKLAEIAKKYPADPKEIEAASKMTVEEAQKKAEEHAKKYGELTQKLTEAATKYATALSAAMQKQ